MNADAPKNRELIKQYPFLKNLIGMHIEPDGLPLWNHVDDLTIRFEKADGDLMFRQADNVGLGDSSCVFSMKTSRQDQVMRCGEYFFAIGESNQILNRVDWSRNEEEKRGQPNIFAWSVFWTGKIRMANGEFGHTNPIWDKVKYLVWITVNAWHKDTKDDSTPGARFGEFCDRSLTVTVYTAPAQGFEKLQKEANFYENLSLNSSLVTRGIIHKDHDIITMTGMIYEMCITFQDEVFFNGMKEVLDKGKYRGASGLFGSVKVLCAEMCGYDRIMLEDSCSYVTFQRRPDSDTLYVLGQSGTLPQIRNLVRTVVKMWNNKPESRLSFKSDGNVSVI